MITISGNVTNVGDRAFSDCSNLKKIIIPESVNNIGTGAFNGCNSLDGIMLPKSITIIKQSTFSGCSNLNSIIIPSNVESVSDLAFSGCGRLTSVIIPVSVTSIKYEAFFNCSSLKDIYYAGNQKEWSEITIGEYRNEMLLNANIHYNMIGIPEKCEHVSTMLKNVKVATCTENGYTGDKVCDDCGEILEEGSVIVSKGHTEVVDAAIEATCTTEGKTEGSHCSVCDTIMEAQKIIPVIAHTCTDHATPATATADGTIVTKCTKCRAITATTPIYYPKTIKLAKTTVTYNGKAQKPSVTIKDSKGNKIDNKNYTVTYQNNKNVGIATATITFKGNYTGTIKKTFQIVPKSTTLAKVTAKKKGFTAKWKKQTSQTTGYQIQYAMKKNFKGAKTTDITKNKTTSKSVTKLKARKKYYVRIRTYKTVKINGKSTKLYSSWSKPRSVTTKK